MQTAVVNVRLDPKVKKEAQEVAEKLGFSLSSLITGFLTNLTKTKAINFSLSEEPSEYFIQSSKEAKADIKAGRVSPTFDNVEDAIAWLDNPKRKYVNQIRKKV